MLPDYNFYISFFLHKGILVNLMWVEKLEQFLSEFYYQNIIIVYCYIIDMEYLLFHIPLVSKFADNSDII